VGRFDIPLTLCATAIVSLALWAIGARLRRLLRLPCPPSLRAPVAWCLGSWAAGVVVLACGLAGGMAALPLVLVTTALSAFGRYRGVRLDARRALPYLLAALPLVPIALAPPFFYDAWVYHLGLPWQSLREGAIRAHPENVFSTFPPLAQLVYAVPLSLDLTRVPACLHLVTSCLGAQAVAGLARRLGARALPATVAGIFFLYAPMAVVVPAFPAAEGWVLAGIASAAAIALTGRPAVARGGLAGWMVGIALATRLQGAAWTALVGCALAARGRRRLATLAVFAACAALGSMPWWLKNAVLLSEPVAPIGWEREGLETLWRDGQSLVHHAARPFVLLTEAWGKIRDLPLLLLPPLVLAAIGAWSRRRPVTLLALGLGVAGLGAWAVTGSLGRFLVPAYAVLLAVAVVPRRRALALVATAAVIAGTAIGLVQTAAFLARGADLTDDAGAVYARRNVADPYPAYVACATLPADARILVVAEPRGFLLPRPFVTTSQHDPTPLREVLEAHEDASSAASELRRRGFTHLLVNTAELRRLGSDYPVLPWKDEATRDRASRLVAHLGEPVVREGPVVVYALQGVESRP
jgi:hypothetical protein